LNGKHLNGKHLNGLGRPNMAAKKPADAKPKTSMKFGTSATAVGQDNQVSA
jgi:hypothetical protein